MIELERTYLVKKLPDLKNAARKEMVDVYVPKSAAHPNLRIRKNGEKHEITKKTPVDGNFSELLEETIHLTPEEYESLAIADGKRIEKTRYCFDHEGVRAEVDVFRGGLAGLVLADFEFETPDQKNTFSMPDFCLVEVTQEEWIAGGMLCGKDYAAIEEKLLTFGYSKIEYGRAS